MKGALDTLFLAGTNVAVFHSYTHQPDDTHPGWQMEPWGISQNRKTVWWPISHDWFKYAARIQYMLQQGKFDNRILILSCDSVPWTGDCPGFPEGYQADTVDGDSVRNFLKVKDGKLVSPGRQEYSVLIVSTPVLKLDTLRAIKAYIQQGAVVAFLERPIINTTLRGGTKAQAEMEELISELFPEGGGYAPFLHGHVVDMLYFPLFQGHYPEWMPWVGGREFLFFRPVFNLADSAITIGFLLFFFTQRSFWWPEKKQVQHDFHQ